MAENERTIPSEAARSVSTFTILSEGVAVTRTFQVLSIVVHKEVNRIPQATIVFLDGAPADETFPISNAPDFEPGKKIEIRLGFRAQEETVFKGIVIKHGIKIRETGSVLTIECRDEAVK